MNKRYFIKTSHIEEDGRHYINYYGQDAKILAIDYKSNDRHVITTMRSDFIKRHGYKTQSGAENSYNFKRCANDNHWKTEIIWYYC